jgi:hypothetical protein
VLELSFGIARPKTPSFQRSERGRFWLNWRNISAPRRTDLGGSFLTFENYLLSTSVCELVVERIFDFGPF